MERFQTSKIDANFLLSFFDRHKNRELFHILDASVYEISMNIIYGRVSFPIKKELDVSLIDLLLLIKIKR